MQFFADTLDVRSARCSAITWPRGSSRGARAPGKALGCRDDQRGL